MSPYFATNQKNQICELDNPLILIANTKVTSVQSIYKFLEYATQQQKPLVIIAEDVESEPLAALILNKLKGVLKVCCVKTPGFGDNRKKQLEDIAILTKSEVIDTDIGMNFDSSEVGILGSAKKMIIKKDDTIIIDGAGEKEDINKRVESIREEMEASTSDYDKEKLQERQAKLSGGVGVIKVGGATEVEVKEIKDRLDDAINATRSALDEGIVVGGGSALLYASLVLKGLELENFDQTHGMKIVMRALEAPCKRIVKNSGYEGSVVVQKLIESVDRELGYDAYNNQYVNMKE